VIRKPATHLFVRLTAWFPLGLHGAIAQKSVEAVSSPDPELLFRPLPTVVCHAFFPAHKHATCTPALKIAKYLHGVNGVFAHKDVAQEHNLDSAPW
jgi:hypothetical protein